MSEKVKDTVLAIVAIIEDLTDDEREEVFQGLREEYCLCCGKKEDKDSVRGCQCWNDE